MKIELSCTQCGNTRFNYPLRFTSTSVIKCGRCGHVVGTVAEIQQKVMRQLTGSIPEKAS